MTKGYFTDKSTIPGNNGVMQILGKSKNNWELLLNYLTLELKLKGEFKFYGVNYGWAMRFNKSGRSIVALYPDVDRFTVQIILNKNQVDFASKEDLQTHLLKLIEETEPIHEGK